MLPQENARDAADIPDELAQGQGRHQPHHPHSASLCLCEEYSSRELQG